MSIQCPQCGFSAQGVRCEHCGAALEPDVPIAEAVVVDESYSDASDEMVAVGVEAMEVEAIEAESIPSDTAHHHGHAMAEAVTAKNFGVEEEVEPEQVAMKKATRDESELDMTPMVDVTFLLLIFFMVTASFSLQKSITMPREQSDAPSTNQQDEEEEDIDLVTVQIDEFNSFTVLAADWEREVPGKQNLIRALKEAKPESEARLKIEVHENAVIEAVVDAMDAGAEVGFSEIQKSEVKG